MVRLWAENANMREALHTTFPVHGPHPLPCVHLPGAHTVSSALQAFRAWGTQATGLNTKGPPGHSR